MTAFGKVWIERQLFGRMYTYWAHWYSKTEPLDERSLLDTILYAQMWLINHVNTSSTSLDVGQQLCLSQIRNGNWYKTRHSTSCNSKTQWLGSKVLSQILACRILLLKDHVHRVHSNRRREETVTLTTVKICKTESDRLRGVAGAKT